jgi:hypothetical protein
MSDYDKLQTPGVPITLDILRLLRDMDRRGARTLRIIERLSHLLDKTPYELIVITEGQSPMPGDTTSPAPTNFQATTDHNYALPNMALTVAGLIVPAPSDLTLSVTNSTSVPGLTSIGTMADGTTPALIIDAGGQTPQAGVTATITDTSTGDDALPTLTFTFDLVEDQTPVELYVDTAQAQATVYTPPVSP